MNMNIPQQPGMSGGLSNQQSHSQFGDNMMTSQGSRQTPQSVMQGQPQQPQQSQQPQPQSQPQQQQQQPAQGFMNLSMQQGHNQVNQNNQPPVRQQQVVRPQGANGGFSQEENVIINRIAQSLASNANDQEKENIRAKLHGLSLQQRQAFEQQNIDPMFLLFRQQAMQFYLRKRAEGVFPSAPQQGNNARNVVNGQRPQHSGMQGTSQGSHQITQFMDQQQIALREAANGQMVVPASQPQNAKSTSQKLATPQPSKPSQTPTGFINQSGPHMGQRPEQMTPNPNVQRSQQGNLMGQVGGINGPVAQGQPQPSPAMSNINQPLNLSMQRPPSQNTSQNRPPQQIPQTPMQGQVLSLVHM